MLLGAPLAASTRDDRGGGARSRTAAARGAAARRHARARGSSTSTPRASCVAGRGSAPTASRYSRRASTDYRPLGDDGLRLRGRAARRASRAHGARRLARVELNPGAAAGRSSRCPERSRDAVSGAAPSRARRVRRCRLACSNDPYPNAKTRARGSSTCAYARGAQDARSAGRLRVYDHEVIANVYETLLEYHYLKRPYELIPGLLASRRPGAAVDRGRPRRLPLRAAAAASASRAIPASRSTAPGRDQPRARRRRLRVRAPAHRGSRRSASPVLATFAKIVGSRRSASGSPRLREEEPGFAALRIDEQYARAGPIEGLAAIDAEHFELIARRAVSADPLLVRDALHLAGAVGGGGLVRRRGRAPALRASTRSGRARSGSRTTTSDAASRSSATPDWYGASTRSGTRRPRPIRATACRGRRRGRSARARTSSGGRCPSWTASRCASRRSRFRRSRSSCRATTTGRRIPKESFDSGRRRGGTLSPRMQALGMRLERTVMLGVYYVGFNMTDPWSARRPARAARKLRQAMSLAVDARRVPARVPERARHPRAFAAAAGPLRLRRRLSQPVPPVRPRARARRCSPRRATRTASIPRPVARCGSPSTPATPACRDSSATSSWSKSWRRLGLDVEIAATHLQPVPGQGPARRAPDLLLGLGGRLPGSGELPVPALERRWARPRAAGPNSSNFADPRYDALFEAMRTRDNDAERLRGDRRRCARCSRSSDPGSSSSIPRTTRSPRAGSKNVKATGLTRADLEVLRRRAASCARSSASPGTADPLAGVGARGRLRAAARARRRDLPAGASVVLAYLLRRSAWGAGDGARRAALPVRALLPGDATRRTSRAARSARRRRPRRSRSGSRITTTTSPPSGTPRHPFDTRLAEHLRRMLFFDFGRSDADDVPIAHRLRAGIGPTLCRHGAAASGSGCPLALSLATARRLLPRHLHRPRRRGACVLAMSVSMLIYILGGQYRAREAAALVPDLRLRSRSQRCCCASSRCRCWSGVLAGIGANVRFYRTVFLEESGRDYVRTARAKGAGDARVMLRHVLPNALIPVLTHVVDGGALPVHGLDPARVVLRHPGPRFDHGRRDPRQRLRDAARDGLPGRAALRRRRRSSTDLAYTLVDPRVRLG